MGNEVQGVNVVGVVAIISLLLSIGTGFGTIYVVRYRVERLEQDFRELMSQLRVNAELNQRFMSEMTKFATREADIEDHEDRIRELEKTVRANA